MLHIVPVFAQIREHVYYVGQLAARKGQHSLFLIGNYITKGRWISILFQHVVQILQNKRSNLQICYPLYLKGKTDMGQAYVRKFRVR